MRAGEASSLSTLSTYFYNFWGLLSLDNPIGWLYSFIKEIFLVLVVLGASVFVYYRLIDKQRRMTLSGEGLVILGIIITMMLADMLYNGARLARSSCQA